MLARCNPLFHLQALCWWAKKNNKHTTSPCHPADANPVSPADSSVIKHLGPTEISSTFVCLPSGGITAINRFQSKVNI